MNYLMEHIKSRYALLTGFLAMIIGVVIIYEKYDEGWWDFFSGMITGIGFLLFFGHLLYKYKKRNAK